MIVARRGDRLRWATGLLAPFLFVECTYLITFDDVPKEGPEASVDASFEASDGMSSDASTDAPDASADASDAAANVCLSLPDGRYCGNNGPRGYTGSKDDLITCKGDAMARIDHCAEFGAGCKRMPTPYPDECDQCASKPDGYYCGRDMTGWSATNANVRVQCDAHAIVTTVVCPGTCASNGSNATCR